MILNEWKEFNQSYNILLITKLAWVWIFQHELKA